MRTYKKKKCSKANNTIQEQSIFFSQPFNPEEKNSKASLSAPIDLQTKLERIKDNSNFTNTHIGEALQNHPIIQRQINLLENKDNRLTVPRNDFIERSSINPLGIKIPREQSQSNTQIQRQYLQKNEDNETIQMDKLPYRQRRESAVGLDDNEVIDQSFPTEDLFPYRQRQESGVVLDNSEVIDDNEITPETTSQNNSTEETDEDSFDYNKFDLDDLALTAVPLDDVDDQKKKKPKWKWFSKDKSLSPTERIHGSTMQSRINVKFSKKE